MSNALTRTRFAPSPTGSLHLGNLRTALFNALLARRDGGSFLLRIEDTDRERSDERYVAGLLEDLRWLGLEWHQAGGDGAVAGAVRQSARGAIYGRYFERLIRTGRAYHCFCTERDLARARAAQRAAGKPPRYPGTCAGLSETTVRERLESGDSATLRFRVGAPRLLQLDDLVRGRQTWRTEEIGDFVIRRADGSAAFFFSNAIDDALMEISHVLRGEDHVSNTPRQYLLLEALELPVPAYGHISLIVGSDEAPLSKRHGARSIADLRARGYRPLALLNHLARLGHRYDDEALRSLDLLAGAFRIDRLGRAPARFDPTQLDHWQAEAVRASTTSALLEWLPADSPVPAECREAFAAVIRPNVRFPEDVRAWAVRLFGETECDEDCRRGLENAGAAFFESAIAVFRRTGPDWPAFTAALGEATGARGRAMFMPLRLALTGSTHGPELAAVIALLSAERVRARLRTAADQARSEG